MENLLYCEEEENATAVLYFIQLLTAEMQGSDSRGEVKSMTSRNRECMKAFPYKITLEDFHYYPCNGVQICIDSTSLCCWRSPLNDNIVSVCCVNGSASVCLSVHCE